MVVSIFHGVFEPNVLTGRHQAIAPSDDMDLRIRNQEGSLTVVKTDPTGSKKTRDGGRGSFF